MNHWKKTVSLGLALMTLLSCTGSVLAAPEVNLTEKEITGGSGTAASVFTGTIVASKLTVSLPTTVAFEIDPTKTANLQTDNSGQINQAAMTIINDSAVPIDVIIKECTTTAAGSLVTTSSALTASKSVMFAIKNTAPTDFTSGSAAEWLTTNPSDYRVLPASSAIKAGGSVPIYIFGQTQTGWKANDTFTVSPIFTVSAATGSFTQMPAD